MVVHVSYVSKHNEGQRNPDFREDSMELCSSENYWVSTQSPISITNDQDYELINMNNI